MIGYFGGTFDPPHEGHAHLIRSVLKLYSLNKLFIVPTSQNPLKTFGPCLTASERLLLVQTAIAEIADSRVEVLDWEIKSPGPSYTVETLERLRGQVSEDITFFIGNEAFRDLPKWKKPKELLEKAHLVVIQRTGETVKNPTQLLYEIGINDVHSQSENRLSYFKDSRYLEFRSIDALSFSSTALRNILLERWNKNELADPPPGLQRSVWLLIKEKHFYSVRV